MLWLFFIVECGITHFLCAMPVFEVRASSSSPRLPLCQISFLSRLHCWASTWRKIVYSITQSLSHPTYLMSREPKLALQNIRRLNHAAIGQVVNMTAKRSKVKVMMRAKCGWQSQDIYTVHENTEQRKLKQRPLTMKWGCNRMLRSSSQLVCVSTEHSSMHSSTCHSSYVTNASIHHSATYTCKNNIH